MRRRRSFSAVALVALCLSACVPGPNDAAFCHARASGASGTEVIVDGSVTKLLGTAAGRSGEHEGFFMRIGSTCSAVVRVETNVDFTGPVPLRVGERVEVKGEYDADPSGDVIHFTHRELRGHHPGGYVKVGDTYYW